MKALEWFPCWGLWERTGVGVPDGEATSYEAERAHHSCIAAAPMESALFISLPCAAGGCLPRRIGRRRRGH
jgi:hypothetical protein